MKVKVFTAFSGYDSQCMALDRLVKTIPDFDYELVGWSEIDKFAIASHNAVYPQWEDRNYGDISKVDWNKVPDFDVFTYSFPCQSISAAGLQKGLAEGGTRSGLLWECKKTILAKRPRFLIMENVKALTQKKFMPDFQKWIDWLTEQGYTSHWQVLNACDYGVPQNRERVFMVSSTDPDFRYDFPSKEELKKELADVLDDDVDERYYIKTEDLLDILVEWDRQGKLDKILADVPEE